MFKIRSGCTTVLAVGLFLLSLQVGAVDDTLDTAISAAQETNEPAGLPSDYQTWDDAIGRKIACEPVAGVIFEMKIYAGPVAEDGITRPVVGVYSLNDAPFEFQVYSMSKVTNGGDTELVFYPGEVYVFHDKAWKKFVLNWESPDPEFQATVDLVFNANGFMPADLDRNKCRH